MKDSLIWNELGTIYLKMGDVDEAIAAFNRAIETDKQFGLSYCNLAFAFCQKEDFSGAIPLYEKSIALLTSDEEKITAWIRLGDAYYSLNDRDRAIAAYKMAHQLNDRLGSLVFSSEAPAELHGPESTGNLNHGYSERDTIPLTTLWDNTKKGIPVCLKQANEIKDKIQPTLQGKITPKIAADLVNRQPSTVLEVHNNHAVSQDFKKPSRFMQLVKGIVSPEEAPDPNTEAAEIGKAEWTCQGSPESESPAATADLIPEESEIDFALSTAPQVKVMSDTDTKDIPTNIHPHENDLENGIAYLKNITTSTPANDKAWDAMGNLLRAQGNYDEAVVAFEQAISLYPEKEEYHYHLGLVYTAQKRFEDANKEFQKVIQLNSEYVLARGALAGNLRRLGREDEAMEQIRHILPLMQNEKEYNRACFEAICGNTDQALEFLRIALERKQTPLDWVRCDPDLDFIRDDPRFIALINHEI